PDRRLRRDARLVDDLDPALGADRRLAEVEDVRARAVDAGHVEAHGLGRRRDVDRGDVQIELVRALGGRAGARVEVALRVAPAGAVEVQGVVDVGEGVDVDLLVPGVRGRSRRRRNRRRLLRGRGRGRGE